METSTRKEVQDNEQSILEVWTSYDGRRIPFGILDHQHLSNILWFTEVVHGHTHPQLQFFCNLKYGYRLEWRPLPIPGELKYLRNIGCLREDGTLVWNGKVIGRVNMEECQDVL